MAWDIVIPAVASVIGGALSGEGNRQAGEAEAAAARDAARLSKEIYYDQRGLARPGYMTGGAATNKLAAMFGIAPQDYAAAFAGANSMPMGGYNSADWGAGQPVAGHTGGGGRNMLMPLVREGGDNWTTLATSAPAGMDYDAYFAANPDLMGPNGWGKADNQKLFNGNRDAYAWWHYNNMGKGEGRTLNPIGGNTQTNQPVGGATQVSDGASDPMAEFMASPYNKLATEMSDIDFGKIKGQLGAAGKSISGPAEARYAKTLAGNRYGAFGDYTNALRSLAGMQQTASSQISGAAGQYGANAGNAMMAAGQARGNALAGRYNGIAQGVSGAIGAVQDYGKKNWNWA